MRIYIGADHRGFKLKEQLKVWLGENGHEVVDMGAKNYNPDDDYIDFAIAVSQAISNAGNQQSAINPAKRDLASPDNQQLGILICGSGVGMDIVANKVKGIRCGLGLSKKQVAIARYDDDINILALAADYISPDLAQEMAKFFLETPFSGKEKYKSRIEKITAFEHLDA